MTQAILERTRQIRPAAGQPAGGLRIVPVLGDNHDEPDYSLLEPDILEKVRVKEVDESGSVPTLIVENDLDAMLFLMDGQELLGAKQNRILNTDVLVAPRTKTKIPVSCVEAGRWSRVSDRFKPGTSASHRTRSAKMSRVRESLEQDAGHDADQGAVWDEVQACLSSVDVTSETSALSDAYASRRAELLAAREALTLPPDAVGLAVFRGNVFLGLDLFDRHSTCRYFWDSLVDSYLIDAHDDVAVLDAAGDEAEAVQRCLSRLADTSWQDFEAAGLGRDWRCRDERLEASALVWEERVVVHLQVFPRTQRASGDEAGAVQSRPRLRRRYMERDQLPGTVRVMPDPDGADRDEP